MKSTSIIARTVVLACLSVLFFTGSAISQEPRGFLGEKKVDLGKGSTTWWLEDDGVVPSKAGCHVEIRSQTDRTPTGRSFGEWCEDRNGTKTNATGPILVETGPATLGVHEHPHDVGHPKLIDCAVWCGKPSGMCRVVAGPPPCATSAICSCN